MDGLRWRPGWFAGGLPVTRVQTMPFAAGRNHNSEEGADLATTLERVQAIAVERLGVDADQVVASAEFIGDLNADSLDLVEVIMAMEQEFDLEIKDEDAENIRTVGDAVKYIEEHAQS